jgi:hypothetical protein
LSDDHPPRLAIPLDWVIVDAIGAVVTGLGVLGLAGGGAAIHPLLDHTAIVAACVVVGVATMGLALVRILQRMRASASRRR